MTSEKFVMPLLRIGASSTKRPPRTKCSKVKRGKASLLDPMKGAMSRYTRTMYSGNEGSVPCRRSVFGWSPFTQIFMLSHSSATGFCSIENVEEAVTRIVRVRTTRFISMKSIVPSLPSEYIQRNRIYAVHRKGNRPSKNYKASLSLYEPSIHPC